MLTTAKAASGGPPSRTSRHADDGARHSGGWRALWAAVAVALAALFLFVVCDSLMGLHAEDELDAIGRSRGGGPAGMPQGGGFDERENTLNQLLVELDGDLDRDDVRALPAAHDGRRRRVVQQRIESSSVVTNEVDDAICEPWDGQRAERCSPCRRQGIAHF